MGMCTGRKGNQRGKNRPGGYSRTVYHRSIAGSARRLRQYRYQRYGLALLLVSLTLSAAGACARQTALNCAAAGKLAVIYASALDVAGEESNTSSLQYLPKVSSRQRVIDCSILEKRPVYELNQADYETLLKIVEAEAGGEDEDGKLLVANVVLNRVNSSLFPDTVTEVVYQRDYGVYQFSPVGDGRIGRVTVSGETRNAVERAIYGEDISQGALYFVARNGVSAEKMQWFDSHLTRLFVYGGHEFFG